jgi:hypothetical protein
VVTDVGGNDRKSGNNDRLIVNDQKEAFKNSFHLLAGFSTAKVQQKKKINQQLWDC